MASGTPTRTTCPYCGVGCGVVATPQEDGSVAIKGDERHPANYGRLCSKGSALGETLSLDDRLLHPEIDGRRAGWNEALDLVAARFSETIAEHGPESVAFYGSGQLLTEDYYVANKLMKGFIGAANIDTNSRLCMASSVAGHIRAFGSDTVPGTYEDLEEADLVVLVGSNMTWCHPVLFQRLLAARERRGTKIVVIDPRRTVTAEAADLHLAVAPNSDVALFAGLLDHLDRMGLCDGDYVGSHTSGLDEALQAARECGFPGALIATRLPAEQLREFYTLWSRSERVVTAYSQGVNQSVVGTDKVNAIINCHLFTGRIGRPGMGPFSLTGQPNAMGGREVGGLANMLAAHLDINNPDHRGMVQAFWNGPRIAGKPGLKAVDLFRAVGRGAGQGDLDHGHQSGRFPARCGCRSGRLAPLPVRGGERCGAHRHDAPCACAPARRRLGGEERHGDEFRAPHLAPALLPEAARRGTARLAHHLRCRLPHGLRRSIRLSVARRDLP